MRAKMLWFRPQRAGDENEGVCKEVRPDRDTPDGPRLQAEMQLEGHSSMQAPQLLHLEASMIATSSQVMAFSGQTSTHAPHATHSEALTVVISITSDVVIFPEGIKTYRFLS